MDIRTQAARLYSTIDTKYHRDMRLTEREKAVEMKDAFESLQLERSSDPVAQVLARTVASVSRQPGVYEAGLRVAGVAVGGPMGAALAGVTDHQAISTARSLCQQAGAKGRELLEAIVPEEWTRGEGLSSKHELMRSQWEIGAQRSFAQEGQSGMGEHLHLVQYHLLGQGVRAQDVVDASRQRQDFDARSRAAGLKEMMGFPVDELEGRKISMLYPTPGEMKELTGTVTGTREGYSAFQLAEHPGMKLSSNEVAMAFLHSQPGVRDPWWAR